MNILPIVKTITRNDQSGNYLLNVEQKGLCTNQSNSIYSDFVHRKCNLGTHCGSPFHIQQSSQMCQGMLKGVVGKHLFQFILIKSTQF